MPRLPVLVTIFVAVLLGLAACILFFIIYRIYLNRRLKGEGEIKDFPQPQTFILIILLAVSFITNIGLIINIATVSDDNQNKELLEKTQIRSIAITDMNNTQNLLLFAII